MASLTGTLPLRRTALPVMLAVLIAMFAVFPAQRIEIGSVNSVGDTEVSEGHSVRPFVLKPLVSCGILPIFTGHT